jgi:adenylate cyclase
MGTPTPGARTVSAHDTPAGIEAVSGVPGVTIGSSLGGRRLPSKNPPEPTVDGDGMGVDANDAALEPLLDGLTGALRDGRRRLLVELRRRGYSIDSLENAIAEDRLAVLLLDEVLADGATLTAHDVAESYNLAASDILRASRLLGLRPASEDDPAFDESQRLAFGMLQLARSAGVSEATIDTMLCALAQHLWQLAADVLVIMGDEFIQAGDTEYELAHRYEEAARVLVPGAGPLVAGVFGAHLRVRMRDNFVTPQEAELGALRAVAQCGVAFVDVVGFTELSERLEAGQLKSIATRLVDAANAVVEPPVRLVKTVGDAIMLMSRDTVALVDTLVELFPIIASDPELPAVHSGLASGPAHIGGADVYGATVNLASRLTDLAPTGKLWAHDAVVSACAHVEWCPRGHQRVKGLHDPVALYELGGVAGGHDRAVARRIT